MSNTKEDDTGTVTVADSEVVSVLRKLAGRECRAIREDCGAGGVIVGRKGDGELRRGGGETRIEAAVWQRLLDAGLIVPDCEMDGGAQVGAECWRISNAGRIQLRRRLSRAPEETEGRQQTKSAGSRSQPCKTTDQAIAAPSESPLAWLARRRDKSGQTLISQDEFHAGERLRADFTLGQMMDKVTSSWSPMAGFGKRGRPLDGELSMSEAGVDARERVRAALADVGPELSGVLIDVCCYLKGLEVTERAAGWPQRSGKLILQMALRALVRHYKSRHASLHASRPESRQVCQRRRQSADAA